MDDHNNTKPVEDRLTTEQHDTLEAFFLEKDRPSANTKKYFAKQFDVSVSEINQWFQERRAQAQQQDHLHLTKKQRRLFEHYFQQEGEPNINTKIAIACENNWSLRKINKWFQDRSAQSTREAKQSTHVLFGSNASFDNTAEPRAGDDESTSGLLNLEKGRPSSEDTNNDQDLDATESQPDYTQAASSLISFLNRAYANEDKDTSNPFTDEGIEASMKCLLLLYGLANVIILAAILASDAQNREQGWTIWAGAGAIGTAIWLCIQGLPRPFRGAVGLGMGQLLCLIVATALMKIGDGEGRATCEVGQ